MSQRSDRLRVLRTLLAERELRTHADVRAALATAGHPAHAATIGRDLEEVGARRVRGDDGQLAYRVGEPPLVPTAPPDVLDDVLARFVLSVAVSGNLLVLRTPPACAAPVASALDTSGGPAVLGTVGGDDTVLAVIAEGHDAALVAETLRRRSSGTTMAAAGRPR
jgi:transcriptional regulator of arginine metabolism